MILKTDAYREERAFSVKTPAAPGTELVAAGGSTTTTSTAALVLTK